MTSVVVSITFDCADPLALAQFWSQVVKWPLYDDVGPDDVEVGLEPPAGHPQMLFVRVPEGKAIKNRVHMDVVPQDCSRDEEVERLLQLGARIASDQRKPNGRGWAVLADPEGNEFCVERGDVDRQRAAAAAAAQPLS